MCDRCEATGQRQKEESSATDAFTSAHRMHSMIDAVLAC